MYNKLYGNNFPNNLKIARRTVTTDPMVFKIKSLLSKIEKNKNEENKFLKHYIERSVRIGK